MHFQELPTVLQDIVCDFAWQTEWEHVEANINQLFRIKEFDLPPIFFRPYIFYAENMRYELNPLHVYAPVFDLLSLFNRHRIHELLYKLDFRKRDVKCLGSRLRWMKLMDNDHESILQFGMFYKMLLSTRQNIWTPTYRYQLTHHTADHLA